MPKIEQQKEAVQPAQPFQSVEEETEFWDTHSALEAIDPGTVVGFRQAKKTNTLTVRFEPSDLRQIREEANKQGIGPTTLVRIWCGSIYGPMGHRQAVLASRSLSQVANGRR